MNDSLSAGGSKAELQSAIDAMYWHHSIDFGDGVISKSISGLKFTQAFGAALFSGLHLEGRAVLDIGAWNGAYSFDAKRRGAARVVASDHYVWKHDVYKGRDAFELARRLTGLDVEAREIDVADITLTSVGSFDAVLFAGVFYHLIDPVHLTRQVSECARHLFIVETHQDSLSSAKPAMTFYPAAVLNGDPSNWWGPNPQCVFEMLIEFGFHEIRYRETPGFAGHVRGIYQAFRDPESMAVMGAVNPDPNWLNLSDPLAREALFAPR